MQARGEVLVPDIRLLWDIQVLDMHRRILEERLRDQTVPDELKSLKNSIDEAQDELSQTRLEYVHLKKDVHMFDLEDERMRREIDNIESELRERYAPGSPDAAVGGQRVRLIRDNLENIKERQFSLLEIVEGIRMRIEEQGRCLAVHREKYRRLQGTYQMNVANIRKALAQIPLTRQRMIDAVDAGTWKRYAQLKTRFKDPVGKVEKGVCGGCRTPVPFKDLKRLRMDEELVYCGSCGRLLYWERVEKKG